MKKPGRIRKSRPWMVIAGALLLQAGCGTVIRGPYQTIPVKTTPPDAEVIVQCKTATPAPILTPATVRVHRKSRDCSLLVRKVGYKEVVVELKRERSGIIWGNLGIAVPAGVAYASQEGSMEDLPRFWLSTASALGVGLLVDFISGGAYMREPEAVDLVLEPEAD